MAARKKQETNLVALYTPNGLYDSRYGRLNRGYNVVQSELAAVWLGMAPQVRKASAEEVALAYGVK